LTVTFNRITVTHLKSGQWKATLTFTTHNPPSIGSIKVYSDDREDAVETSWWRFVAMERNVAWVREHEAGIEQEELPF